ncbi:MAG: DNRLRE domain-containing protein [bacterium]
MQNGKLPVAQLSPCVLRTIRRVRCIAIASALMIVGLGSAAPAGATGLIRYKSGPIAISEDGSSVWVVNTDANTVSRIAAGPDTLVATISVGSAPRNVAISPNGAQVWVTNHESNTVSVIQTATNTVSGTLPTLVGPFGVCFSPSGSKVYVVNQISDSLLTFDANTQAVIDRDVLAHRPRAVAVTNDGSRVMVQHFISLNTLMQTNFFDASGGSLSSAFEIVANPVCAGDGGYPGVVQAIAVAPGDTTLWIPVLDVNPQNGEVNCSGGAGQLTLNTTLQAVVREVRISSRIEINENANGGRRRLNAAGANVQMPSDVGFTTNGFAYLPCSFSNNVLKINTGTNPPTTLITIPVGDYPDGIVLSPTSNRAYVRNFLSRNVMVIDTDTDAVIDTIQTTTETLSANVLNGKKLFSTATGAMSTNNRIACAGCHPEGTHDGANWDFSHFGDGKRNTQTLPGISTTPPFHSIGDRDEIQDFEKNIEVLHFGAGLAENPDNPAIGSPNAGRAQNLDDLVAYINSLRLRDDSPYRNPIDQSLTASAAAGKILFESDQLQCRFCHPEPLYTDNIIHDVGTFLANDTSGYQGFDTPSLRNIFDTDPYLHAGNATSLQSVIVALNSNSQHGVTSQLTTTERNDLIAYLRSIVSGREDVTPPRIEYARTVGFDEVIVRFLEPVDPVTATDIANYTIDNGISILSASLDPFSTYMGRDGLTVHLFTSLHLPSTNYTVTVRNVKDLSMNENAIPPAGVSANYTHDITTAFTFSNVDTLYTSRLGRDTYVNATQPTWNYGKSTELRVGLDTDVNRAITRFDFFPMLSTVLPDTTEILSAKIRMRLKSQSTSDPVTIYTHRLLKYFVEGSGGVSSGQPFTNQSNWNSAREGRLAWSAAGAAQSTPGVEGDLTTDYLAANDRAFTPDDSAIVAVVGDWYEWDVTHSVKWAFANPFFWNFGHIFVAADEAAGSGKVFYSLQDPTQSNRPQLVITLNADNVTGIAEGEGAGVGYSLAQTRPNPAAGPAHFAFALPRQERVTLRLFDVSGRAVRTIAEETFPAGRHEIAWDGRNDSGRDVASGTYFYRIKAGRWSDVRQMVVIR